MRSALDIVFSNYDAANQIFWNDGTGGFPSSSALPSPSSRYNGVAMVDVNGDGLLDVYVGQEQLFINSGSSAYMATALPVTSPHGVTLGDVNNDVRHCQPNRRPWLHAAPALMVSGSL